MKTIKEWLEELPEPIRTRAINNAIEDDLAMDVDSMLEAINLAFQWSDTPEGGVYWDDIYVRVKSGKPLATDSIRDAAPELLETLEAIHRIINLPPGLEKIAIEAIRKARGNPAENK